MSQDDLRYPVGRFEAPAQLTDAERAAATVVIASLPRAMRDAVAGLTPAQIETPYRPDGWSVRQVVHHVPESHMHAYCRFKFALLESQPTIKPYDESTWSTFADQQVATIDASLLLLDGLHQRWTAVLSVMTPAQFARTLFHPENGEMRLDQVLASYAWHSRHHVAHITSLRARKGW